MLSLLRWRFSFLAFVRQASRAVVTPLDVTLNAGDGANDSIELAARMIAATMRKIRGTMVDVLVLTLAFFEKGVW